ncbi:MAG: hypothetical protein HYT16_01280 [DPANN group archaeon]|nr:hypothetical protein [DPANN group archaeon]
MAPMPASIKVAVDVDGVLADLHQRFLHMLNKDHKTGYMLEDIVDWNVWEVLPLFKAHGEKWGVSAAKSLCWRYFDLAWLTPRKMRPVRGAVETMQYLLSNKDIEVHIVTARQLKTAGNMIDWLDYVGIHAPTVTILDAHTPHTDKAELGFHTYIDDSPRLATAMANHPGSTLLLFDAPYNQKEYSPNVRRMGNWRQPETLWQAARVHLDSLRPTAVNE